jgi:hypothetical protein
MRELLPVTTPTTLVRKKSRTSIKSGKEIGDTGEGRKLNSRCFIPFKLFPFFVSGPV